MDKIGDGECDPENLVGFCSFDGYDCCNVTESNKTFIGKLFQDHDTPLAFTLKMASGETIR